MIAEALVEETRLPLTSEMIEVGRRFVRELKERSGLTAGFWLYVLDTNTWRLYIATAGLRDRGARPLYAEAQRLLQEQQRLQVMRGSVENLPTSSLSLSDIYAIDDRQQIVSTLRTLAERQGRRNDLRVTRTTAHGHFVEDAYIYLI